MANKRDPFSWVQDTTGKAKKPKSAKKSPAKRRKAQATPEPVAPEPAPPELDATELDATEPDADESASQRFIFVKYDKNDGRIVATHEIHHKAGELTDNPWTSLPENRAAARVALTGELADKDLSDIHSNYKVVISNRKLKLVLKS